MVSAAIVISVQSTSVKAANLLASFIVIPVAILMQGEAVMLFWGNDQVLWLAIFGVMIIALLLIRVGIAHFHREYLLGREIDAINLGWIWRTFLDSFLGGAKSVRTWYSSVVGPALRRVSPALLTLVVIAGVSVWMGYDWSMDNIPAALNSAMPEEVDKITRQLTKFPDARTFRENITAPFLFMNNTRAVFVIFLAGLVSFSVLGVLLYMVNISLIGGLFGLFELLGIQAAPLFLAGVLPHGILEIPALMIGSAAMLYFGVAIVTPQTGRSMGEVVIELLADWTKIFIGLVVPLLAAAAMIEAYITPWILRLVVR
jgi:uncharacterized membrane protein SpoIIM required for sporulation